MQQSMSQVLRGLDHQAQMQYYFILIVKYFLAEGESPAELRNWSSDILKMSSLPEDQPGIELVDIFVMFMRLHSTLRRHPYSDAKIVIHLAQLLDRELDAWETHLPDKWTFVMEKSDNREFIFNGQCHVYQDVWVSRTLSHYQRGRLLVNELILCHFSRLKPLSQRSFIQRQQASNAVSRMATYICIGAASQMSLFGSSIPTGKASRLPPLNGVFMLLFPLAVAGSAAGAPDQVLEWVVETLQRIWYSMGIQPALELTPRVKQILRRKMDQWQNLESS